MRLRNIPRADAVLDACPLVVKEPVACRGKWNTDIFQNEHPIHIEIGMGKGQFLLTLARQNPQLNYIGIERYSSVLLRAVEKFQTLNPKPSSAGTALPNDTALPNIRFICMDASDIAGVFAPGEVDRIYLNFSDPWPKARHAGRRLTSREFLARYDRVLAEDGTIEFKTDNRLLFDFSVSEVNVSSAFHIKGCTYDLHHDDTMNQGNIMTEYEEKFSSLGNPICKLVVGRTS